MATSTKLKHGERKERLSTVGSKSTDIQNGGSSAFVSTVIAPKTFSESVLTKPQYCYESGCPLAMTGKGFCLGVGNPETARHLMWFEAPGSSEVEYKLNLKDPSDAKEFEHRLAAYPQIEKRLLLTGKPLVGKAGALFDFWLLKSVGIKREDVFLDNTLRCLPPKHGDSHYPTGETRKKAEACCRYYDRWPKADLAVINLHPAALLQNQRPCRLS